MSTETKHEDLVLDVAFSVGRGKNVTHWNPSTIAWWKFLQKVEGRLPTTKEQAGGYVFGRLVPTPQEDHKKTGCPNPCGKVHRNRQAVEFRSALALDVDKAPADFPDRVAELGIEALLHTTANSTPGDLRLRLVVPTDQRMDAATFKAATNELMRMLSRDGDDPATFDRSCNQPSRFMYLPAAPDPAAFKAWHFDGDLADPALLALDAALNALDEVRSTNEDNGDAELGEPTDREREKAQNTLLLAHKSGAELTNPIGKQFEDEPTAPGRNEWVKNWATPLLGFVKYGALELEDVVDQLWLASLHAPAGDDDWDRSEFDGVIESVWSYAKPIRPKVKEPLPDTDEQEAQSDQGDGAKADAGSVDSLYEEWDVEGDVHLAKRVALKLRENNARPLRAWGKQGWALWTGKKWDTACPIDTVRKRVIRALLQIRKAELEEAMKVYNREMRAAASIADGEKAKEAEKAAERKLANAKSRLAHLRQARTVDFVVKLARADMSVALGSFDGPKTADWLNVANGMVNLRTGELKPHDPSMMFTKASTVEYHPDATHPDWDKALEAVPAGVRDWFQKRCGQAATGHPPVDDVVPFLFGGGANGKSTLLVGVTRALGDFYVRVPEKTMMKASQQEHDSLFLVFKGARLAVIEELPGDKWLDDERLKKVVGTEDMTARPLYEQYVTWQPTHSLMVSTNHETQVRETDHGTWRRLARVTFPYTFDGSSPDHDADPTLRERLKLGRDGQHEAALAWLVAGAVASYAEPLTAAQQPEQVKTDTAAWRTKGNSIMRFVDECLTYDPSRAVLSGDVYIAYREWAKERGQQPMNDQTFWSRVAETPLFKEVGVEKKLRRLGATEVSASSRTVERTKPVRVVLAVNFTDEGRVALELGAGLFG